MFLSVIVPVYNSEHYLKRCLDSVLAQSLGDYEVILVDDGSFDSSREMCRFYCKRDGRFKLVEHMVNQGASAARNTGLRNATGDYVMFLDNDDWIEGMDAFAKVYESMNSNGFPDVLCCPMGDSYYPWDGVVFSPSNFEGAIRECGTFRDVVLFMLRNGLYYSSASGKVVKRSLIEDNALRFDEGLRHNEDTEWSRRILCCMQSVSWTDSGFYVYRRNSNISQSSCPDPERVLMSLSVIIDRHVQMIESGLLSDVRAELLSAFVAYVYVLFLAYAYMDNTDIFRDERQRNRRNAWLLDSASNGRVSLVRCCYRLLGMNATGRLLAFVMRREQRGLLRRRGSTTS